MALISATFRLSQSTPFWTPLLLVLYQNLGMRASDLKSFGFASHFLIQSCVSFPETMERSGPTLRIPSYPGILWQPWQPNCLISSRPLSRWAARGTPVLELWHLLHPASTFGRENIGASRYSLTVALASQPYLYAQSSSCFLSCGVWPAVRKFVARSRPPWHDVQPNLSIGCGELDFKNRSMFG